MLFQVSAGTEWPIARKEVDLRSNVEKAEDDKKKDARSVEPLRHAVSLTKLDFQNAADSSTELGIPEAGDGVIVDHADGLHEGVTDGGADEAEAAFFQVFAHGVGYPSGSW